MRLAGWLAAGLAGVLAVAGCTDTPEVRPPAAPPPARTVPLEQADVARFWSDFDRRLNTALQQALLPPYPSAPLRRYATGPELAVGEFNVALEAAGGRIVAPADVRHAGVAVYSGRFGAGPVWVMVGAQATAESARPAASYAGISVFSRSAAGAPWLLVAFAPLAEGAMPPPYAGADATAAGDQVARADRLGGELASFWESGREPAGLVLNPTVRGVRDQLTATAGDVGRAVLRVERFPGVPTYAVRVRAATLAMLSFRASVTYRARPGRTLRWTGPRALLYGSEPQRELVVDYAFNALLSLPDEAGPGRLLALGLPEILTAPRDTA